MEMTRVGDVMIPLEAFPHIPYWFSLRQALAAMQSAERECVPGGKLPPNIILVFSADNLLLGTVGGNEIMRGMRPNATAQEIGLQGARLDPTANIDLYTAFFNEERVLKQLRTHMEKQIVEFMTPVIAAVDCDDHVLKIIYLMIDKNMIFVPVARNAQIVGMAYAEDVIHEVIKLIYPLEKNGNIPLQKSP